MIAGNIYQSILSEYYFSHKNLLWPICSRSMRNKDLTCQFKYIANTVCVVNVKAGSKQYCPEACNISRDIHNSIIRLRAKNHIRIVYISFLWYLCSIVSPSDWVMYRVNWHAFLSTANRTKSQAQNEANPESMRFL